MRRKLILLYIFLIYLIQKFFYTKSFSVNHISSRWTLAHGVIRSTAQNVRTTGENKDCSIDNNMRRWLVYIKIHKTWLYFIVFVICISFKLFLFFPKSLFFFFFFYFLSFRFYSLWFMFGCCFVLGKVLFRYFCFPIKKYVFVLIL